MASSYISNVLFRPPKPLIAYPADVCEASDCPARFTSECELIYGRTRIPSVCCSHPNPRMVVVFSHGNSENIVTSAWFAAELSRLFAADVYSLEYPGYFTHHEGHPTVQPSEAGCFDASSVFVGELARVERERRGLPVVLVGYSLGCAITLHAADVHRKDDFPSAVLLLAPFVSAASVVLAPQTWMLSLTGIYAPFDVMCMRTAALRNGHTLFIAHGSNDEVIPVSHGRAIASWAAKHSPKDVAFLEVPDATHASLRLHAEVYEAFLQFLGQRLMRKRANDD